MARSRSKPRSTANRREARVSKRAKTVWLSLLVALTGVGGVLVAIDDKPTASPEGLALPALAVTTGPAGVEAVFNTRSPLASDNWKAIVIHDSGKPFGTAESLESEARSMNLRGLGYHFVIGNGNGLDDGKLHIGGRWLTQSAGAHAAGKNADWYNRHAIGICLVGDGDRRPFTQEQMSRLAQLVQSLQKEFNIPSDQVLLHRQIAATPSPGRLFSEATLRQQISAR